MAPLRLSVASAPLRGLSLRPRSDSLITGAKTPGLDGSRFPDFQISRFPDWRASRGGARSAAYLEPGKNRTVRDVTSRSCSMALLQAVPSIQPGSERPVLILIECACTSAHLCPAVWDLVHSHRRDAGAEGGTHDPFYEDVCGSLWRGCNPWGHGFLGVARIDAGGHV